MSGCKISHASLTRRESYVHEGDGDGLNSRHRQQARSFAVLYFLLDSLTLDEALEAECPLAKLSRIRTQSKDLKPSTASKNAFSHSILRSTRTLTPNCESLR